MRTEPNPQPFFGDSVGPWHDHFAWVPIRTYEQQFVWLRWVRRRQVMKVCFGSVFDVARIGHMAAVPGRVDVWFQYHNEPMGARV